MLRSAIPEPLFRRRHMSRDAVRLQAMLQTSSQGRYPFFYPQCPAPAFYGSLTGYWATCLVGHISEDNPSFPGPQPLCSCSVSGPSYPLIRVLFNFPSLTGTKPACLFGGFRSRSTSCGSSFFLLSLCAPTVFPVQVIRCQSFIN